ncbi:D-alanyl-D-alanine carboxypeptidase [Brevinema andersonii]|uniref:D-alanyl-D-alanine carboxypeptidase n=1 Tax=Brevinema andersonii TaxID=34097 RepID=A0A1I1DGB2_BREAD|nr:M15 family metallopeptidase [Brevinema andersonii]SFB71800.1 D-alanyl-D-alanine carboxypeptidase [Brevinema andersonii]
MKKVWLVFLLHGTAFGNFSGTDVFKALEKSYPSIVTTYENTSVDPAILVNGKVFYWISNRILPENAREDWEKYGTNTFYVYPESVPDLSKLSDDEVRALNAVNFKSRKPYHPEYHEVLYAMRRHTDTNKNIIKSRFLGKQVRVHRLAYKPLKCVEREILALAGTNKEAADFLRRIDTVYSFYWRKVESSSLRSMHSYGIGIDILDSRNTKKNVYWLWRKKLRVDWVREPLSRRWIPLAEIVKIFEKYGFVWGGKWLFYDTIHFEYRPEILILNGYEVKQV